MLETLFFVYHAQSWTWETLDFYGDKGWSVNCMDDTYIIINRIKYSGLGLGEPYKLPTNWDFSWGTKST